MAISPTKYNDLITNAPSRAEGFRASADAFRRDSASLDGEAKDHEAAAAVFEQAGNYAEAENRREHARKLRDDANTCLTYAAKHQERANSTANGKAPAA